MLMESSPLQILRRFSYTKPDDAARNDAIKWQSGKLVEAVTLFDPETGSIMDATVDESLNGEATPQTIGRMTFEVSVEAKSITTRSGREGSVAKFKHRLVKVTPVKAA